MYDSISVVNGAMFLVLGFIVGILSGFFGVGGAFILTPFLHIIGIPMSSAVASGLAFTVGVSTFGGLRHYFAGNVSTRVVIYVGFLSLLGVSISQPLVVYLADLNLADHYIRLAYIFLLLFFGLLTFRKKSSTPPLSFITVCKRIPPLIRVSDEEMVSFWVLLFISLFVGFLKGFLGVGGGFILVPLFILLLDMDPRKAAGTSLMVLIISSFYGTVLYIYAGLVYFHIVGLLIIGSLFGINIGVTSTIRVSAVSHQNMYSLFLVLMSFGILAQHLGFTNFSLYYSVILVAIFITFIVARYYFDVTAFVKNCKQGREI